jgi:hypothetical protein
VDKGPAAVAGEAAAVTLEAPRGMTGIILLTFGSKWVAVAGSRLAGTGSSGTARTQVGGIGRAQSRGNWRTMGCSSITKMASGALAEHVGGARGKGRGWNMGPCRTDGSSGMANEQAMDQQAWAMTAALGHRWVASKAR